MARALGVSRSDLLLRHLHDDTPHAFAALLDRRLAHEPIAYITGKQEFWGLSLTVTRDTLIPRPDSETLITAAIAHCADAAPTRILDLGTGSGALLLAALSIWPDAHGTGIDASPAALAVARSNASALGLAGRSDWCVADWRIPGWAEPLGGPFDLIMCNPPYVETGAELAANVRDYEPHSALFAGQDGMDDYRLLIPKIAGLLSESGIAIFEIGATQADAVGACIHDTGAQYAVAQDLAGHDRAVIFPLGKRR